MRVCLIYPGWPENHWPRGDFRSHWVPTGIAHIAHVLEKNGCEVRILNCEELIIKKDYDRAAVDAIIMENLREFMPDMVGLSILTPGMIEAGRMARLVKSICAPGAIVVAGGPHVTALPERTLREIPELDGVVVGDGEPAMLALAERGLGESVPGLLFRNGSDIIRNAQGKREKDLDRYGIPPYHLFDMNFYAGRNRWMIPWLNGKVTNIRTSRGCVGTCSFCAGPLVSGPGVRFHSIEHVIEQVRYVVKTFGVEAVHFEDDSIGADPNRLSMLCRALRNSGLNGLRWDCCLRVDQVNPELLREMKAAGCIMVEYGIETGSEAMLGAIGKRSSREMNRRAVEITRKAGIRIFTDIMFGLPGETEKDWKETVDFLRWAKPDIIRAALLCPLPGTAIFNNLPVEVRDSLRWENYTYMDALELGLLMSDMELEKVRSWYRDLHKYFLGPHLTWGLLRDSALDERRLRAALRKKMISFVLRHPLKAARLPLRWRMGPYPHGKILS